MPYQLLVVRVQILCHTCKNSQLVRLLLVGIATMLCSIQIICLIFPEKPYKGKGQLKY